MSTKIIVYPSDSGLVLLTPCECGLPIEEIARKDVPPGLPYLILEESELPEDITYAAAWTADFSSPDGHGIGAEAWFAEREAQ